MTRGWCWTALILTGAWLGHSCVEAGEPIGWRTDGTGSYPKAEPPLEWSTTRNVLWKTPMPGGSNSVPVLLGQRVFICSEPCTLLCLNKEDGKILWQKNNSFDELDIEPTVREHLAKEKAEVARLDKMMSELNRNAEQLRKKIKDSPDTRAESEKELEKIKAQVETLKAEKAKLTVAGRYTERDKQSDAGYSTPTPVTNGKEIFVAFGNGLVACFDLEGKRKWLKLIEHSTAPFAHANSPVLVGDKMVIHFAHMVALRISDGTECWRVKDSPAHGTSVTAHIGATDVLLTPGGSMIDAASGTVLATGLGRCGANSPILHEKNAYFVRGSVTAVKLPDSLEQGAKPQQLWAGKVKGGGYWFPSPVVDEGRLYSLDDRGIFTVLDAKTGESVYEQRIELGGTHYPSITVAAGYLFLSSDNGKTLVVRSGPKFETIAENQLEPFRSSLVFEGKRMYVRTHKHLYCIGQ